jgi:hypothetical protein
LCPLDYTLDGRMYCHEGRDDLPDMDLEVSSLHEAAVFTFVQYGGALNSQSPPREDGECAFPTLRAIRAGVHVSMGARQAVRAVGAALGMEAPRVNTVARQVPLLSSPGAIDNIMTHAPELGIKDAGAGVEPYNTLVRWRANSKAYRTGTAPIPLRTPSRSTVPAYWHGYRRSGFLTGALGDGAASEPHANSLWSARSAPR